MVEQVFNLLGRDDVSGRLKPGATGNGVVVQSTGYFNTSRFIGEGPEIRALASLGKLAFGKLISNQCGLGLEAALARVGKRMNITGEECARTLAASIKEHAYGDDLGICACESRRDRLGEL